jgi:hypothetical protein
MERETCSTRDCGRTADSVVRTKQSRGPGSGPITTVTWYISDASEVERRLGTLLCAEHRDHMLAEIGKIS